MKGLICAKGDERRMELGGENERAALSAPEKIDLILE
jgi:hypothetical protein